MSRDNVVAFFIFIVSVVCFFIWGYNYIPNNAIVLFALASVFGIFMAFNIGGNDVANSFGTSVGAKTVTIKQALIIAAVFELSGAIFAGGSVTNTIRSGIVVLPSGVDPMVFVCVMLSALLSSGIWLFIASKKGLPVSTTHSIIGGIVGSSIAMGVIFFNQDQAFSMVNWSGIYKIVLSWIISPLLGGLAAYLIYAYIYKKILKPSIDINLKIKIIKKEKKAFKEEYFKNLKDKTYEEQIRELSAIVLDDDEKRSEYKLRIKALKEKEKNIDVFSKMKFHVPLVACIAALVISSMFLFKGLNNVSTLNLIQNIWIVSIISIFAYIVTLAVVRLMKKTEVNKTIEKIFSWFQIFTASSFAFSHGANDIANALGPFAAILDVLKNNTINPSSPVPFAVMFMFGIALVIGLWFLGKEVIQTVGSKLAEIKPTTGFSAELGASIVILLATQLGIPVSSTHILIGAILGIGVFNKDAKWSMMKPIGLAWVITLPVAGILSSIIFMIFIKILVL
ncbi:inorganic phosphate transporter [Campylobacter insulaenigrae]|uniref:inorganic phosphate transporter n=1 Tax=Campylobacter insulaenigrae TaxID=260714 RepID=UPI0021527067|nr:inorganic phosphate transporter [Campylobacter insulaenigrae]MCR6573396.1 inorganic phosphate transporter [Campylobacter insulaenigrae]MCR6574861.1 inorganic phosphate transporter [Campylobacter insulaenigrae]MCR6577913.1 inorganic phosphate transporter [Campylobacter insulaenigrae]MCR6579483.1 inorganic phosphate transporter [Campylobacter insulaenigrae]MCR6584494.1 inorganic phosphate transporter [Campylobacter insulaenigrae]